MHIQMLFARSLARSHAKHPRRPIYDAMRRKIETGAVQTSLVTVAEFILALMLFVCSAVLSRDFLVSFRSMCEVVILFLAHSVYSEQKRK